MSIHLILGGARSGKSRHAERLAHESGLPVTAIVTAEPLDPEMTLRIRRHRLDRPPAWRTVEAPHELAAALRAEASAARCVIVDCLTLWLANLTAGAEALPAPPVPDALPPRFVAERAALLAALPDLPGRILIVSNEIGLGLVPGTPLGRLFRDEAGRLNQAVAALSDRVSFVAAGLALSLKG
jgi:adenosylcobinamide kinase/adenosylcobinamide-phosphate guanylyltransferase